MLQEPYQQVNRREALSSQLETLSAREQISLLLSETRSLSNRDKADVFSSGGLSFLKNRFLPIVLHFFIKWIVTGAILWIVCIIAVFVVLLLLAWVEQISPQAVTPVVIAGGGYFLGFLLFSCLDFLSEIAQFFKTTRSRSEFNELVASLNMFEYGERVVLLRSLSVALSRKVPGRSLLASLILSIVLLLVAAVLIGLVIVLSRLLPVSDTSFFLVPVAIGAFLLGFFVPREFQRRGPASIRK